MKLRYIIKVPNLIRLLLFKTAQQQHTAYISSNLNTNRYVWSGSSYSYSDLGGCCIFLIWGHSSNLIGYWGCWETFVEYFFQKINSFMPFLASEGFFLASDSLLDLRGQKLQCLCYHTTHLQQIDSSKVLCGMYGLMAKSSGSTLNILRLSY